MKIVIEEVHTDDGSHGMVAKWDSPEGCVNFIWETDLTVEDYAHEPFLMERLKDDILQAYRENVP